MVPVAKLFTVFALLLGGYAIVKICLHTDPSEDTNSVNSPGIRTETDLETIYSSYGVPVEFWYNESNKNPLAFASAPGCPRSTDGIPWIYFGNPPRCFLAYKHGPCPYGERLIPKNQDSLFGHCICECLANHSNVNEILDRPNRYEFCQESFSEAAMNGQIYDKKVKKCYRMYEQGPCKKGNIIARFNETGLTCLPECNSSDKRSTDILEFQGLCTERKFLKNLAYAASTNIGKHGNCPQGQRYSDVLRKCVKRFDNLGYV